MEKKYNKNGTKNSSEILSLENRTEIIPQDLKLQKKLKAAMKL